MEYTKPESDPTLTQFSMTYTGSGTRPDYNNGGIIRKDNANNFVLTFAYGGRYIIPSWDFREQKYVYAVDILAADDIYNVTVNGNTVQYDADEDLYHAVVGSSTLLQEIIIIISDKQI